MSNFSDDNLWISAMSEYTVAHQTTQEKKQKGQPWMAMEPRSNVSAVHPKELNLLALRVY